MLGLDQYINSRLKTLVGSFKIYKNKEGKFLHLSEKANIKVDLDFWEYIKTVKK
jgi:hypothetical protein